MLLHHTGDSNKNKVSKHEGKECKLTKLNRGRNNKPIRPKVKPSRGGLEVERSLHKRRDSALVGLNPA